MKCQNCGEEIPDSAKVCGYCGTKTEAKPEGKACPNCGVNVPFAAKACGKCGHLFRETSNPTEKPGKQAIPEKPVKPTKAETKGKALAEPASMESALQEESAPAVTPLNSSTEREKLVAKKERPKWLTLVVAAAVVAALALVYIFFLRPVAAVDPILLAGTWKGDDIEVVFTTQCEINATCGEFILDDGTRGSLMITYQDGNEFGYVNPQGSAKVYEEWVRIMDTDLLELYSKSEYGERRQFLVRQSP